MTGWLNMGGMLLFAVLTFCAVWWFEDDDDDWWG